MKANLVMTLMISALLTLGTSSAQTNEHRLVINSDGSALRNGTALRSALIQTFSDPANPWFIELGAGTFDISNEYPLTLPHNVHLSGAGMHSTNLVSYDNGGVVNPAIEARGSNDISNLSLSQTCVDQIDCTALRVLSNPSKQVRLNNVFVSTQGGLSKNTAISSASNLNVLNSIVSAQGGKYLIGIDQQDRGNLKVTSSQVQTMNGSVACIGIRLGASNARSFISYSALNSFCERTPPSNDSPSNHWQVINSGRSRVVQSDLTGNFSGFADCRGNVINDIFVPEGCSP
jgi:hypothetical protein